MGYFLNHFYTRKKQITTHAVDLNEEEEELSPKRATLVKKKLIEILYTHTFSYVYYTEMTAKKIKITQQQQPIALPITISNF